MVIFYRGTLFLKNLVMVPESACNTYHTQWPLLANRYLFRGPIGPSFWHVFFVAISAPNLCSSNWGRSDSFRTFIGGLLSLAKRRISAIPLLKCFRLRPLNDINMRI